MRLTGTVRNVVDFGAFVDIGVKQDGLVHISEMADFHVRNPYEIGAGDIVQVTILNVDVQRGRIAPSLRTQTGSEKGTHDTRNWRDRQPVEDVHR